MIPKYSNEIYEIITVNKNNVTVNNNGKNKIIKNDNLKIINNTNNPVLQSQKTANIQHKINHDYYGKIFNYLFITFFCSFSLSILIHKLLLLKCYSINFYISEIIFFYINCHIK